ncbi:hypothetical protein MPLSOD_30179 [Mesorhizobium sp. SOD10]|nr:hypothetical protein MPLSOD_30179 [Mesorhizobium sp. SOD10]
MDLQDGIPVEELTEFLAPRSGLRHAHICKRLVFGDSVHGGLAHALSIVALVDPHSVSASPSHLSPRSTG